MRCAVCQDKTERLFIDGSPICDDCAKKKGYELCTETGAYINFLCSHVCSDCDFKEKD